MKRQITKMTVFDFDGTLCDTPLPDVGRGLYEEKTGTPWPHVGWWGKSESLCINTFDIPTVPMVMDEYQKVIGDDNVLKVMLTGRMVKLQTHVETILTNHNLYFDEYHYNRGGSTDTAKIKTMESLLNKYNKVTELEMLDDRLEHIPIFQAWGDKMVDSGRLKSFNIIVVPANRH